MEEIVTSNRENTLFYFTNSRRSKKIMAFKEAKESAILVILNLGLLELKFQKLPIG